MKKIPLYFPFLLALFAALFGNVFFPYLHLSFFAPLLALSFYAATLSKSLWISLGCGLILDLISSEFRFGLYSLTFVLATLLLYAQKKHFFEDKPLALSLFSSLIAAFLTVLQFILVHLFDRGIPFSILTVFTDVIFMSAVDGLYAFLWFTCPMRLYIYIKKVGWKRVFRKAQHEEE
jgi:rod shape-determining protein MreD